MNSIILSSKSNESEIIRKKENILLKRDNVQRSSITNENQDYAIIEIEF